MNQTRTLPPEPTKQGVLSRSCGSPPHTLLHRVTPLHPNGTPNCLPGDLGARPTLLPWIPAAQGRSLTESGQLVFRLQVWSQGMTSEKWFLSEVICPAEGIWQWQRRF